MKTAVLGALVGASLVLGAVALGQDLASRAGATGTPGAGSPELISLSAVVGDHRQQVVLVDPRERVMGVYQVDGATGEIALRSVRNFHWDLQMLEFNATSPLPREVRSLLEQK